MVNKIYSVDWFGRKDSDYIYNPSSKCKGIVSIPNHKYSSFLYNEDKAERILSNNKLLINELSGMTRAIGLTNVAICLNPKNRTASTNGRIIEIGVGEDVTSIKDRYDRLDHIIGLTIHEACHCLYTDFSVIKRVIGKYPALVHHIHNLIEDEMIEGHLSLKYPGYTNYLNKLKYDIFTTNMTDDLSPTNELEEVLNILFYIIRYPKYLSTIPNWQLDKWADLFVKIKAVMKEHKCFNYANSHPTESSTNAAIDIYKLICENVEMPEDDNEDDNKDNKDNENDNENNGGKHNGNSDEGESEETDENGEPAIVIIMGKVIGEVSSASEITNIKDLIIYHSEINELEKENDDDYTFSYPEKETIVTDGITNSIGYDRMTYMRYAREMKECIQNAKKLIIENNKSTVIENVRFNRNGTLDPTRLANAMCNEQTVYIRRHTKTVKNNDPKYALVLMLDESGSMDGNLSVLTSKLAVMFYEAMKDYPNIQLFVYGHGDTVYKYIDNKTCNNKYVLGARKQQFDQNEVTSYPLIIKDVKKMTKLPIIAFNITDSCYIVNTNKLAAVTNVLRNDPKQKACINLIALGHNNSTNETIKTVNDKIYGKDNWVLIDGFNYTTKSINKILADMVKIMKRTNKL